MTKRNLTRWIGSVTLGACLAFAPQLVRAETAPAPAALTATSGKPVTPKPGAGVAREAPTQSYAQREARNPSAGNFEGGESVGIYIGGSAVAVVLAIVLLVVLL